MTRDEVIRLAREAGLPIHWISEKGVIKWSELERFAYLVAAHEREECARVCEKLGVHPALNVFGGGPEWYRHGRDCAAAIRARGINAALDAMTAENQRFGLYEDSENPMVKP